MTTLKRIVLYGMTAIGLLASCSFGEDDALPVYAIKRTAYEDVLVVEGYTESVNSVNINCPPHLGGTIVHIVESGTEVKKGDVVCVLEDANLAESCERLELDLESARAEVEKLQAAQQLENTLLEAQVKNNEAEAILAESDSIQMLYMSPVERRSKALQLERARVERDLLYKKMEAAKVMQKMDLVRAEKRIRRIERRLDDERRKLESLTLKAPCDGIAVRGRRWHWSDVVWNIGDQVRDGRTVVTLPDFKRVKVIFHAQETEYKRMQLADSVVFAFDASPENYGWGRIVKMASVGQERTSGSQVKTFEVEVSVDSLSVPVEPGLSAKCHIYTKYIPDMIVVPTISIFDRDSLKVVYVQKGKRYEEREVKLGIGSPKMTIISEGLHEGERITLIKPKGF
jgi:multidrug efflux pump subunit AcrA (membrane-fusion protein)